MEIVNTEIKYKTNFFSNEKTLVFAEEGITLFKENIKINQLKTDEIESYRFGINWIRGIDFYIGRVYHIDLRDKNKNTIKIRLRSLYGINKNKLAKKYSVILDILFDNYFDNIIATYIRRIENGEIVEIADIIFKKEGVYLESKKEIVKWEDLNTRAYSYYYTLASKQKPDYYKALTYLVDWNAGFVYCISRSILKSKGLYSEEIASA